MKKTDRRVARTKRLILDAVMDLLSEKKLQDITVREITERADIDRKTFYNHYGSIYESVEEQEDNLVDYVEEMFNKVLDAYRSMGITIESELIGNRPCTGDVDKTAHENLIAKAEESVKRVLGQDSVRAFSSTDANTALAVGIPAICIGGAVGGNCHTREEWLDPQSLLPGSSLILDFLSHYFC